MSILSSVGGKEFRTIPAFFLSARRKVYKYCDRGRIPCGRGGGVRIRLSSVSLADATVSRQYQQQTYLLSPQLELGHAGGLVLDNLDIYEGSIIAAAQGNGTSLRDTNEIYQTHSVEIGASHLASAVRAFSKNFMMSWTCFGCDTRHELHQQHLQAMYHCRLSIRAASSPKNACINTFET